MGVLFDGLRAYDKDMLAGDAFDYEAPNDPTEDDELEWKDLSDQEQSDVVREVENDADEEIPRYEIEEIFQKSLPKKDIGFDYDRGIILNWFSFNHTNRRSRYASSYLNA